MAFSHDSSSTQDKTAGQLQSFLQLAAQRPLQQEELIALNNLPAGLEATLGLRYTKVSFDEVRSQLRVTSAHLQPWGLVNGGVLAAVAESTGSLAGVVAAGQPVVGVNNNCDFIRGVRSGFIEAIATPIQLGRTTQVWEINMFNEDKLVARSTLRTIVSGSR